MVLGGVPQGGGHCSYDRNNSSVFWVFPSSWWLSRKQCLLSFLDVILLFCLEKKWVKLWEFAHVAHSRWGKKTNQCNLSFDNVDDDSVWGQHGGRNRRRNVICITFWVTRDCSKERAVSKQNSLTFLKKHWQWIQEPAVRALSSCF